MGADDWHTAALPRAGIRSMTLCDGPFGVRCEDPETESPDDFNKKNSYPSTCMPCGAAIGASWNEALTERVASAIGREAKNYGVDVILGPAMNHKRTPIGGEISNIFRKIRSLRQARRGLRAGHAEGGRGRLRETLLREQYRT